MQASAGHGQSLSRGSRGSGVGQVQDLLASIGFALPRSMSKAGADGIFGPETEGVVKEFQRRNGLTADGIVGPATIEALEQTIEANPFLEAPDPVQDAEASQFDAVAPVSLKRSVYV